MKFEKLLKIINYRTGEIHTMPITISKEDLKELLDNILEDLFKEPK